MAEPRESAGCQRVTAGNCSEFPNSSGHDRRRWKWGVSLQGCALRRCCNQRESQDECPSWTFILRTKHISRKDSVDVAMLFRWWYNLLKRETKSVPAGLSRGCVKYRDGEHHGSFLKKRKTRAAYKSCLTGDAVEKADRTNQESEQRAGGTSSAR